MVCFLQNVQMDIIMYYVLEYVVIVLMNKYVINMMVFVLVVVNLILIFYYVKVYFLYFQRNIDKKLYIK